jgi:hypothetical protein
MVGRRRGPARGRWALDDFGLPHELRDGSMHRNGGHRLLKTAFCGD